MTEGLQIDITLVDEGMTPPNYAHASDAGADLCSAIDFTLEPFERRVVPTGVAIALPAGHAASSTPARVSRAGTG